MHIYLCIVYVYICILPGIYIYMYVLQLYTYTRQFLKCLGYMAKQSKDPCPHRACIPSREDKLYIVFLDILYIYIYVYIYI